MNPKYARLILRPFDLSCQVIRNMFLVKKNFFKKTIKKFHETSGTPTSLLKISTKTPKNKNQ